MRQMEIQIRIQEAVKDLVVAARLGNLAHIQIIRDQILAYVRQLEEEVAWSRRELEKNQQMVTIGAVGWHSK